MFFLNSKTGQYQRLAAADLTRNGDLVFFSMLTTPVAAVYSDPPWSPGNEKWWRRRAGKEPPTSYTCLLDAWCRCVVASHPQHVFVEQSVNPVHQRLLLAAIAYSSIAHKSEWTFPLFEKWTVQYGSPKRPNALLHFGHDKLDTDPTGMSGEPMSRAVFAGLHLPPGSTVADPCTGLGMTSRLAHEFGLNFVGTELDPKRLDRTIGWLLKHGYVEQAAS